MQNEPIESVECLYRRIKANKDLCGRFELVGNDAISWDLGDGFWLHIGKERRDYTIMIKRYGKFIKGISHNIMHWHPSDGEVYEHICEIGTRGNVTVIHTTLISNGIVYTGSADECKYKRKWLFGKYYYLYAK